MTDDQPPPPPSRRDEPSPAASHHGPPPDDRLRDAWLAEMWAPVREFVPAQEPTKPPKKRRARQSPTNPPESPAISTGCAETPSGKAPEEAPKCA